jgi:hypothetical protein
MSKEISIYIKCKQCATVNSVYVARNETADIEDEKDLPFDINNEIMWDLLNDAFAEDIKEQRDMYTLEEFLNGTSLNAFEIAKLTDEQRILRYIAEELKFSDEGAFTFKVCEHCEKPFMFYVISV